MKLVLLLTSMFLVLNASADQQPVSPTTTTQIACESSTVGADFAVMQLNNDLSKNSVSTKSRDASGGSNVFHSFSVITSVSAPSITVIVTSSISYMACVTVTGTSKDMAY